MEQFNDIEIYEQDLNGDGKLAILIGGLNQDNPKAYMDAVVSKYVDDKMYNEFIEEPLDNPWVRVIIFGINNLSFNPYCPRH